MIKSYLQRENSNMPINENTSCVGGITHMFPKFKIYVVTQLLIKKITRLSEKTIYGR